MNIILFDFPDFRNQLLPFTFTRPVANLRCGILTIDEKWHVLTQRDISFLTYSYLSAKFLVTYGALNTYINGSVFPDTFLLREIEQLQNDVLLMYESIPIAYKTSRKLGFHDLLKILESENQRVFYKHPVSFLKKSTDIFVENGNQIRSDFKRIKSSRKSMPVTDEHTRCYNLSDIFIEEGVQMRAVVLNAENGPIYLGKNSELQEGALIRGPFALGANSVINMGAKIRPDVSIGPFCKIGGEVSNSVFYGFSNKSHDGFVGNSVIGEWCNIGADSNTSNLKNNYSEIKLWSYVTKKFENSGRMFCGTLMGDHVKCGINTMFNTGTTIGVHANIFGGGFPPKFIPGFSWGGGDDVHSEKYDFEKAMEVTERVMQRRGKNLDKTDRDILRWIYESDS